MESRSLLRSVAVIVGLFCAWPALAGRPYTDAEMRKVMTEDEQKIAEIRSQEIAQLKLTLSRRVPEQRRADLYLRLAEIYIEAYRAEFLLEGRAHEMRLEQRIEDKTIERSRSKPYLKAAVQACQEILDLGIRFDKLDQVHYFLAYNYSELGDQKRARENYSKILQKFPGSRFAIEAHHELGEAAFLSRDYRVAQAQFERVLALAPQAPRFEAQIPRVRLRLAWCYYRQKQYPRAVAEMKEAIRLAGADQEKLISIRDEALRDLAIFMTETGKVEDAIAYFEKVAGTSTYYPKVLESLGRQYERNVEPEKAIQVYESLLKTSPDQEAAFRFRVKLMDLDLRKGMTDRALKRLLDPSARARLFVDGEDETKTAWQNLRAMVRRTATENHEKFRKTQDRSRLEVAEKFYQAYLDPLLVASDPRKETPEIQMYLAEVKRELGKSREASQLYRTVIGSQDGRYSKEAAALWTASLADAIRADASRKESSDLKGASRQRVEPSPLEKDFIQASDELTDLIPGSQEAREAQLRAAQVLAGYGSSQKEAVSRIGKILKNSPKTSQALTAARLWLQIYTDRLDAALRRDSGSSEARAAAAELARQLEQIESYAEVLAYDAQMGSKLASTRADLRNRLNVLQIAFDEKSGDLKSAGQRYEKFALSASERKTASKAFENAVTTFLKLGDMESVDRVIEVWQKKIPKDPATIQAMRNSATLLFVRGDFEAASLLLQRISEVSSEPSRDAPSLELAHRILDALDALDDRSSLLAAQYARVFSKAEGRSRVALRLARTHERKGRDALAVQSYRECAEVAGLSDLDGPELECAFRLGMLYLKVGATEDGYRQLRKVGSSRTKGSGAFYVSRARWELAKITDAQISNQAQTGQVQQLPKRLEDFEKLQKAMAPVLEIGGPYALPASVRLGQAALELAQEIERLAPTEKSVRKTTDALRAKAVQVFKQAVSKAQENEWMSVEMPRVLGELSFLERSVRAQGARPELRWMQPRTDAEQISAKVSIEKVREALSLNAKDASSWIRYGTWLALEQKNLELALMALERAQALEPKNAAILNNIAVVKAQQLGLEDSWGALQVNAYLKSAQAADEAATVPKINRAQLLNYYGIFGTARKLWDQVLAKDKDAGLADGLATALQGLGHLSLARSTMVRAQLAGADQERFSRAFQLAAASAIEAPESCLELLGEMQKPQGPIEQTASSLLESHCKAWSAEKKASAKRVDQR
ncbi:MAG: tetratricopeptide repeat protein [Oligoflexia bacterium]